LAVLDEVEVTRILDCKGKQPAHHYLAVGKAIGLSNIDETTPPATAILRIRKGIRDFKKLDKKAARKI